MNTQLHSRTPNRWAPSIRALLTVPVLSAGALAVTAQPAAAVTVSSEGDLRAAFLDAAETEITLDADITLTNCALGSLKRNSAAGLVLNGNGHVITQTCAGARVVNSSGDGALTLSDIVITGGHAPAGTAGGVLAHGDVSLDGATFDGNSAGFAGALFTGGSIDILDSAFTNNSSAANAGAVNADGPVTVSGSTFINNSSGSYGGAINTGKVTVIDSQFIDNAADAGGALAGNGTIDVTDSEFIGNAAINGEGGAIRGGPTAKVTVTGGEFSSNATSVNGGAIYTHDDSSLSVSGAMFTGNSAHDGDGGAIATIEDVEVSGSQLTDNDAGALGGAIYTEGAATLVGSVLSDNIGHGAGGAVYSSGNVTVEGSNLSGNEVEISGGGAIQSGSGFVGVTDSVLNDNTASVGGAVWAPVGQVFAVRSTLAGNEAFGGSGGAISAGDAVSVEASTLSGNAADTIGGAVRAGAGIVTLTNSTISGNDAGQSGGGLWADGSIDLRHVTVVGNAAPDGGNLYIDNAAATLTSFGSALGESASGNCAFAAGVTTNSAGYNVADDATCGLAHASDDEAAGDLQLASLADNGGPTMTHLPAGASPLVDAIPAGDCAAAVDTDQRGTGRPQGDGCDAGAVEVTAESAQEPGNESETDDDAGTNDDAGADDEGGTDSGSGGSAAGGDKTSASSPGSDSGGSAQGGAGSDETATAGQGDFAPTGHESAPETGTSMLPFLIAAAVLLAAGLTILFADRRRKKAGRGSTTRPPEQPTMDLHRIRE